MDDFKNASDEKYDTFVPLDFPPMKISDADASQFSSSPSGSKTKPAGGMMKNSNARARPDIEEGFMFHLGALRRG